uniref:POP1 domain-containing protein n=1 Tax=Gongylonema pulchrum TaxID=637853 RepID=A0A183DJR4_9BILA
LRLRFEKRRANRLMPDQEGTDRKKRKEFLFKWSLKSKMHARRARYKTRKTKQKIVPSASDDTTATTTTTTTTTSVECCPTQADDNKEKQ